MRALDAEHRVAAVAGVEPGVVGQLPEELRLDLRDELHEGRVVAEGVAHSAGEYGRVSRVNTSIPTAPRVVLYARISEDVTGEGVGVRRQLEACRDLAESRGWSIVAEATDNDVSALTGVHRPGYQEVVSLVRAGAVEHVIVWQTSRLLRNRRERAEAIELFGMQRVGIITVKGQDLDLSTAYGRGIAGMLGEFDTMESEVKSERVAAAAAQRARDGRPSGALGSGWEKTGKGATAVYTADPTEAPIVCEITTRLSAGESLLGVTSDLNARGVPAPVAVTWGKTSVKKIALRPANAALRIHHRGRPTEELFPGSWPALVTREEWEKVTALLSNPTRQTNGAARPGARKHLLTWGIGACGVCGGFLRVGVKGNAQHGTKKHLYLCEAKGCVGRDEQSVDTLVGGMVIERLSRPDALDWLRGDNDETRRHAEEAARLRRRLDVAADQYADTIIDARQLERITKRLAPAMLAAERASASARQTVDDSVLRDLAGSEAVTRWQEMPVTTQRAVLTTLGMSVIVDRVTRRGPGFDPASVRIDWKEVH